MPKTFIPCTLKSLPDELLFTAATEAARENPANKPARESDPKRIGVLSSKYWGPKPMELPVAFLEQTPADLAARVVSHMNAWHELAGCNKTFRLTSSVGGALVRVTRSDQGYWSYLGTDVKSIPPSEPTMCLEGFTMRTPESEYKRVIRHETGHTLGFPHEHTRRDLVALLDRAKTVAYFRRTQGWSEEEILAQVLTPIEESALIDPTRADGTSIMAYQLPGSITKDGRPIPGGADLDELDRAYAAKIYPPSEQPPPPPPPPSGGAVALVVLLDAAGKEIARFGPQGGTV